MTQVNYYGFNQRSQSLHFRKGQYDPNTQSVPDESFLNGDARDVQDGRGYLFDGVDSQVQIIVSDQGTLYVSAQLEDGSLDSDISITYDTDRYKIEKTNNEAVQNIKVWTVSNATTSEKKSKELEFNLFAWFKCDEAGLDDSFDSSGNNNHGKIANANLSTFHTTSDKFYSWQNNIGYTYDSVNDRYIPRDELDKDKDVQGNNLQYTGKVPYTVYAKDSNCGKFDGVDSYVDIPYYNNFFANKDFKIQMWVKNNDISDANQVLFDMNNFANNESSFRCTLVINRAGAKTFQYNTSYNNKAIGGGFRNEWRYLEIITEGTEETVYLDGNQVASATRTIGTALQATSFNIGVATWANVFLDAEIADFKITVEGQVLLHYPFSEGNDNFVYDVSGNGYHGEIKNASLTDFWSETQDQFHYNFENGFDLWLDGSGNKLFVPFDENVNSIKTQGDTISGFSWDSKHDPSTNFHNGAETRFDTNAEDPHFGDYKRAVSDTGIHPSNSVSGDDRYYIRKLPEDEADRFTLYLNDQVDPQKLKTEFFTQ